MHNPPIVSEQARSVGLSELSIACFLTAADMRELIEYGALAPLQPEPAEPLFDVRCVASLRKAGMIRRDYDLDLFVVVILLDYLNQITQLELELIELKKFNAPVKMRLS